MGRPAVDITGQRFGMLTAVKIDGRDAYGRPLWLCKCDCGNDKHATYSRLSSGNTASCGCQWRKIKDETGKTYGRLMITNLSHQDSDGEAHWNAQCSCGRQAVVAGSSLRSGKTRSCGCYGAEQRKVATTKHSQSNTPLYKVWTAMKQRCSNPNDSGYQHYGARGITYHPDFETFEGFYAYVKDLYVPGLEMDRIDNDGDYTYGNLRWTTHREQMENTRRTAVLTRAVDSTKVTLRRMAEEHGLTPKALEGRLSRGASLEDALSRKQHERPKRTRNDSELIGKRFHHLVIDAFSHSDSNYQKYYHCECDCGKQFVARLSSIKYGTTQSCGCLQAKSTSKRTVGKSWKLTNHSVDDIKEIKRALWSMDPKDVAVYYNIPLHTVRKLQSQDIYADVDELT